MIANENQRLKIWLRLENKFSYREFKQLCEADGCEAMPIKQFAEKAGLLQTALNEYKDLAPRDAYFEILGFGEESRTIVSQTTPLQQVSTQSQGLGDTVAKITHATGLDKLAALYTEITGRPCGCAQRQDALNKLFPYGIKEEV
jgi:hypothetical protein